MSLKRVTAEIRVESFQDRAEEQVVNIREPAIGMIQGLLLT